MFFLLTVLASLPLLTVTQPSLPLPGMPRELLGPASGTKPMQTAAQTDVETIICRPGRAIANFTRNADGYLIAGCQERMPAKCVHKIDCQWKAVADIKGCVSLGRNFFVRGVKRGADKRRSHVLCCRANEFTIGKCRRLKLQMIQRSFDISKDRVLTNIRGGYARACFLLPNPSDLTGQSCLADEIAKLQP